MASILERRGVWQRLELMLTAAWAIAAVSYGWVTLPQASQVPATPQFLNKLSNQAAAILFARDAHAAPARGALVWTQITMVVRMPNGAALTFPATTRPELVSLVTGEYARLLEAEVSERRRRHMLSMVGVGLLPGTMLLVTAVAIRGRKSVPRYVRRRTEESPA